MIIENIEIKDVRLEEYDEYAVIFSFIGDGRKYSFTAYGYDRYDISRNILDSIYRHTGIINNDTYELENDIKNQLMYFI